MGRDALVKKNWLTVMMTNEAVEYSKLPLDLGGCICTGCSEQIKTGQQIYALNFGVENEKSPMVEYLRFTGMIWHRKCLDVSTLPGMAGRDVIDDDERPPMPSPQSKMTH